MVFLRYEFFKNRGVFPIFRLFFALKANSASGIRYSGKFHTENVFLDIFLERLGLVTLKINKRVKNKAKNSENLKYSQRSPL